MRRLVVLLVALLSLGPGPRVCAEVFLEAKLVVNLLPGVAQTDAQVNALAARANEILALCSPNIAFTLAPNDINRLAAFPAGFARRGNTVLAHRTLLRTRQRAAQDEIGTGGYKIYVADGLEHNGRAISGNTYDGQPISIVRERDGLRGDGHTWAHEIVHGLGRRGHSGDRDRLMFRFRIDAQGRPAGTEISDWECRLILAGLLKLSPQIEVTIDQEGFVPRERSVFFALTDAELKPVEPDVPVTTAPGHLDLYSVRFVFERSADRVDAVHEDTAEIELNLAASLPRDRPVDATYELLIDRDGDDATGGERAGMAGVDSSVTVRLTGEYPFGRSGSSWTVVDGVGGVVELERCPEIEPVLVHADEVTAPAADRLRVEVPMALLGELADVVEVGWVTEGDGVRQVAAAQKVPTRTPRPLLMPHAFEERSGRRIELAGAGFTPRSEVSFFWDNDFNRPLPVTVRTDGDGRFEVRLRLPRAAPGNYFLDAIDSAGRVDIAVVTILPHRGRR